MMYAAQIGDGAFSDKVASTSSRANCSYMLDVNDDSKFEDSWSWLSKIESNKLTSLH